MTEAPKSWTMAKRNRTAVAALAMYRGGQSERDALINAIGGKSCTESDRDLIATELARLIDADAADPAPGPALAVVEPEPEPEHVEELSGPGCVFCEYQGSDYDPAKPCPDCGLVAHETNVSEAEAAAYAEGLARAFDSSEVEAFAETDASARAEVDDARDGEHDQTMNTTTSAEKGKRRTLAERLIAAKVKQAAAEYEVRKLELLQVAELLEGWPKGKPAARMIRASVFAGFVTEAEPYAYRGTKAIGIVLPEPLPSMHVLAKLLDEVPR